MSPAPPAEPSVPPRVLVPITIHFAVRYVLRTGLLERLRTCCTPVLALAWDAPDLEEELRASGVEVVRLLDAEVSPVALRAVADLEVAFAVHLRTPSAAIDQARRHVEQPLATRARRRLRWQAGRLRARRPGQLDRARRAVGEVLDAETNLDANVAFLREHRVDAIFSVTPFTVQELVLLHAAERAALPTCTSILSFDNLTTRPPLPIVFDRYLVWNRFNADELRRGYDEVGPERIAIVGPAQFDFYVDPELEDEAGWRQRLGLPDGARTILYGAGPPTISPHEDQYVDHLLAAIRDGRLPADLRIVLRRHPVDPPERWDRFRDDEAVRFDDPGQLGAQKLRPGQVNLSSEQITALCSTLAHTDVHVNTSSTLTLDGAHFAKPQIGPAYDVVGRRRHHRRARDLYRREHFLPIVASGGLELARRPDELVALVADALARPDRLAPERRAMLEVMGTYLDGRSTERVADEVCRFVADLVTARPPEHPA